MTGQAILEEKAATIRAKRTHPPKYWGPWFARIGSGDMKETNLNIFYHFGAAVQSLYNSLAIDKKLWDSMGEIFTAQGWLDSFLKETEEYKLTLKDSRAAAEKLLQWVQYLIGEMRGGSERAFTQSEVSALIDCKDQLEASFEREYRNLSVFTVTPKQLFDTRLLIENPEQAFSEKIRSLLPQRMLDDFKQAARCLAFEIPTACAFHVCRGTEALIISYCERLLGHPWTERRKNWGRYIEVLVEKQAPEKITTRLREIAKQDRNAYIHHNRHY